MIFLKRLLILMVFSTIICLQAEAQSKLRPTHVGIYQSNMVGQVAIGTDLNQKYFGDLRFTANDFSNTSFGIEGSFNRNLHQSDWFNFHLGLMLGYYFPRNGFTNIGGVYYSGNDEVRLGLPFGFSVMPFEPHRNFAFLLEATPNIFPQSGYGSLRANLGIRYTFRN
jgi:hypothetical protein